MGKEGRFFKIAECSFDAPSDVWPSPSVRWLPCGSLRASPPPNSCSFSFFPPWKGRLLDWQSMANSTFWPNVRLFQRSMTVGAVSPVVHNRSMWLIAWAVCVLCTSWMIANVVLWQRNDGFLVVCADGCLGIWIDSCAVKNTFGVSHAVSIR